MVNVTNDLFLYFDELHITRGLFTILTSKCNALKLIAYYEKDVLPTCLPKHNNICYIIESKVLISSAQMERNFDYKLFG